MEKGKISFLFSLLISMLGTNAAAHDIEVANGGVTIYYNFINNNTELAVSFQGSYYCYSPNDYTGNVIIPKSVYYNGTTYPVTSIGEHAFEDCSGLTSITIPNSVNSIGTSAFGYCSGLKSVTIPSSVTSIGKSAFEGCSGLTSINIPSSVTSIGASAFSGCRGLTSVTIPSSVTSIGVLAFYFCSGLTSIVVEEGNRNYDSRNKCNAIIEKASNKLIAGCNTTTIPSSVTSIGACAFCYFSGLTSIIIPSSVTSIGESAFEYCSGLTSISIPNSVTSIGKTVFSGCRGLTDVTIPNSVTSIGERAFMGCEDLTSVTIPNSVTSIGRGAFWNCSGLTSISIPNSVTSIGEQAFYECSRLASVIIPNSVISIGGAAFYYCRLTSMVVDNVSPPTTEDLLFDFQFSYPTLYVPKDSKAAFQTADNWSAMHFKAIKEFPDPDVNQDGTVNVVDVVDIARFVVGTLRNAFVEFLADLNNSGGVNVADAIVLVNEIAGDTQFARQLRAPAPTGSDVLTLCSVDGTRLSLQLDGNGRYAAFQFDLWLPSDVDVMQLLLNNERCQGHQLLYNKVGDGHYRLVALSASGSEFNGASGELLGLTFDGFATDEVRIDNIHFVTTNGTDVPFDALGVTITGEVTAIRSAESSCEGVQPAYNLNGQRLVSPRKGLNIIGGKKIVVK